MSERLIVIDWGTTAFRAYLVDAAGGRCLDRRVSDRGLSAMADGSFADYCAAQVADWRAQGPWPVYMAGMVGAAGGWVKAPQPPLPLGAADLAAHIVAAPGLDDAWILPGVRCQDTDGDIDVIRGEEVQVFGALAIAECDDGGLCLPGTHSKWVRVAKGRMQHFATAMTGDLYAAVMKHTIISRSADSGSDSSLGAGASFVQEAFLRGVNEGAERGDVLHRLFQARTRGLYGDLAPASVASYVSGVLIGEEIRSLRHHAPAGEPMLLVSGEALREPYQLALISGGIDHTWIAAETATLAGVRAVIAHR